MNWLLLVVYSLVISLSVSPNINSPWLAVGLQPGPMLKPEGFKLVYCYNLETRKLHHIFEAGKGHQNSRLFCVHWCNKLVFRAGDGGLGIEVCTTFSPDGKWVIVWTLLLAFSFLYTTTIGALPLAVLNISVFGTQRQATSIRNSLSQVVTP